MIQRMIQIELTDEECEQFKLFRQYQDDFNALLKSSFFTFKNGQAIVHRDGEGKLRIIEIKEIKWKI